jgi:uncharacterized protein
MTFSLLVKPASADCNLHCSYCFYYDRRSLYPDSARLRMSDEVLERMISGYMATAQPTYSFGWQGGEPTLMGADFFRRAGEGRRSPTGCRRTRRSSRTSLRSTSPATGFS